MFEWVKKLFKKEEEIDEVKMEKVNLEPIQLDEDPTLKVEEAPDSRYTEDYANFVHEQYPTDESAPVEKTLTPTEEDVVVEEPVVEEPQFYNEEPVVEEHPEEEPHFYSEEHVVEEHPEEEPHFYSEEHVGDIQSDEEIMIDEPQIIEQDISGEIPVIEEPIYEETQMYESLLDPFADVDAMETHDESEDE